MRDNTKAVHTMQHRMRVRVRRLEKQLHGPMHLWCGPPAGRAGRGPKAAIPEFGRAKKEIRPSSESNALKAGFRKAVEPASRLSPLNS